ncbi:MAG TPA: tetraacyldisaccharide 4'-kinase [Gemmatimonadales bacterium]
MSSSVQYRIVHWLWQRHALPARAARIALLPLAFGYGVIVRLRAAAYRRGWLRTGRLPLPTVSIGNRSVGGTGKTPLAAWVARHYLARGKRPGILLRGYGGDEPEVHRRLVPQAVVVADPDRVAGAARAQAEGAQVLVLDDAFQLLAVARDLNILVASTEQHRSAPWLLPAGPWREPVATLARADLIVVTRKRAPPAAAAALADQLAHRWPDVPVAVAHLKLARLRGMVSGQDRPIKALTGHAVLAVSGIADPESYAVQVRSSGASVQLAAYQDHHAYDARDVARLVRAAAGVDYVVVTEKDAVKLRARWPADAPEPLVAELDVHWERNEAAVVRALDTLL